MTRSTRDSDAVLAAALAQARLLTPPPVAMQVVRVASDPNCSPAQVAALVARDPALCARVLKAVNSAAFGLAHPVASVDRAVVMLGLNPLRSLLLGLALPQMQGGAAGPAVREWWVASVGGAVLARELSARTGRPAPGCDLVAGLLRELGALLLHLAFPNAWRAAAADPDRAAADPCGAERDVFGIDHAVVGGELLRRWNLPDEVVEPIRHHHAPGRWADLPRAAAERAELLYFTDHLTRLDAVVERPDLFRRLLDMASDRFGMSRADLVAFLEDAAPKVEAFADVLDLDLGDGLDYAAVLTAGCDAVVNLAAQSGGDAVARGPSGPVGTATVALPDCSVVRPPPADGSDLPPFRPAFADAFPPGGCRLDEYELRGVIGRGAMGVVFRGHDPHLDRAVAVKALRADGGPAARGRFLREARAAAAVRHPNVVGIYAVREAAACPYLVMELVEGGTLQDLIDGGKPLAAGEVLRVAHEVAAGLGAAHARGIVHRDVKPANILLDAADGRRARLTDFGLARGESDARPTADGALVGTPLYMAPEVIRGLPADARSDLFGLGGVYYALATGRAPFQAGSLVALMRAVCEASPPPVRAARPDLPAWFDAAVGRLLAKGPGERFASAAAVAAVFDANRARYAPD